MLKFLPKPLLGSIALLLYAMNCIIVGAYIILLAPLKYISPLKKWRDGVHRLLHLSSRLWTWFSNSIIWLTTRTHFDIDIKGKISKASSYILISNHLSWVDIIALQKALGRVAPPSVYFMKRELLWLPLVGICCWLIDFPFVRRYSKAYLERHPKQKGKDIATTRKACQRYGKFPVTLVNYVEGTRYTLQKWRQQHSPYQHLLKPRSGGIAFALNAMRDQVQQVLDTTIIYPKNANYSFWDFLCGKVQRIHVNINAIPVTDDLIGDYHDNQRFRSHFQAWINRLWQKKDELIERYYHKSK